MNPFDLPGPPFLLFYAVLAIAVNVLFHRWRKGRESAGTVPDLSDPYEISYLRGGQEEALRVATISLIDRGLLKQSGSGKAVAADAASVGKVRRPIERAILEALATPASPVDLLGSAKLAQTAGACDPIKWELEQSGLLTTSRTIAARAVPFLLGLVFLVGVSGTKLMVALARGKHNVEFLIFLTIASVIVLTVQFLARRTTLGDAAIARAKDRFSALKDRALSLSPGGQTNEAALLSAVFGLAVLPAMSFPFVREVFPKVSASANGGASGCGGSGCGGGGGGDGGGGGCGGCGGCGG